MLDKLRKPRQRQGLSGAPVRIRTPDLLIRSQTLYPAELRVQTLKVAFINLSTNASLA